MRRLSLIGKPLQPAHDLIVEFMTCRDEACIHARTLRSPRIRARTRPRGWGWHPAANGPLWKAGSAPDRLHDVEPVTSENEDSERHR